MLTVGIDVGGTTVKSALVSVARADNFKSYRVLKTAVVKTDRSDGREGALRSIEKAAKKAAGEQDVALYGVGSAGDVDPETGIVTYATDALPGFTGLDLRGVLTERLKKPVVVINDASAATVGECYFGGGRKYNRALVLTLGTGLGCSLFTRRPDGLNARSVVNYRLGHEELHKDGRRCLCGLMGCAEQYVSATALKRNAEEEGLPQNVGALVRAYRDGGNRGHAAAVRAVTRFFRDFTEVLRLAEARYDPEIVLVGGGVTEQRGWWKNFAAYAANQVSVTVMRAELKNKAGLLGAVYNALNGKYRQNKEWNE